MKVSSQGKAKKKRNKGNKKGKENTEEAKLTLTIDTLNFFDSIKVTPPMYAKDIDETIKKVDEKKAYFIKISDEEEDKPEAEKKEEGTEEVKVEGEEKPKAEVKQTSKKQKINLDDEEMFPSMDGPPAQE